MNWDIEDKSILDLNMYFGVTGSKARCDVIDCARVHHTWHYRNPQNWVVRGKVKAKAKYLHSLEAGNGLASHSPNTPGSSRKSPQVPNDGVLRKY